MKWASIGTSCVCARACVCLCVVSMPLCVGSICVYSCQPFSFKGVILPAFTGTSAKSVSLYHCKTAGTGRILGRWTLALGSNGSLGCVCQPPWSTSVVLLTEHVLLLTSVGPGYGSLGEGTFPKPLPSWPNFCITSSGY